MVVKMHLIRSAGSAKEQVRMQKEENEAKTNRKVKSLIGVILKLQVFNRVLAFLKEADPSLLGWSFPKTLGKLMEAAEELADEGGNIVPRPRSEAVGFHEIEPLIQRGLGLAGMDKKFTQFLPSERKKMSDIAEECRVKFAQAGSQNSFELGKHALGQAGFPGGRTVLAKYLRRDLLIKVEAQFEMQEEDLNSQCFNGQISPEVHAERIADLRKGHDREISDLRLLFAPGGTGIVDFEDGWKIKDQMKELDEKYNKVRTWLVPVPVR